MPFSLGLHSKKDLLEENRHPAWCGSVDSPRPCPLWPPEAATEQSWWVAEVNVATTGTG